MKTSLPFLLLIFTLSLSLKTFAQEKNDSLSIIKMKDGNEFIGTIQSEDETSIQFLSLNLGEITIQRLDVKTIKSAGNGRIIAGKYWYENPYASHYLIAPSGYGLRKGEGYYQNGWIAMNLGSYGFTDWFSLQAGTIPIFIFDGYSATPFFIHPQFHFPIKKDKWNFNAGVIYGNSVAIGNYYGDSGLETGGNITVVYSGVTLGSIEKNLTLSLGYGYNGFYKESVPVVMIGGMKRVSRRSYLITENYFVGTPDVPTAILSFGGRYAARRLAFDYGLFAYLEKNYYYNINTTFFSAIVAPWLGLTVNFGKNRSQ